MSEVPWWALLPPAQAEVSCGEQTHRLLWREGRLTAADHADAEGELVLAALGGARSECMDLVEWWGTRADDLDVLAVGPRSAADQLTVTMDSVADMQAGGSWPGLALLKARQRSVRWGGPVTTLGARWPGRLPRGMASSGGFVAGAGLGRAAAGRRSPRILSTRSGHVASAFTAPSAPRRLGRAQMHGQAERRLELLSLLALGTAFQFRLSATVAAAWADGGSRARDRAAARPALVAALAGRLAPAAQAWLGIDPARVEVTLHEDAGWGRLALSGTGEGRTLHGALPAGWLASVWAAGLAVAAGHLIVEVREAAWPDATVLGVPEPGAEPVILEVRAAGGGWTAAVAGGNGAG